MGGQWTMLVIMPAKTNNRHTILSLLISSLQGLDRISFSVCVSLSSYGMDNIFLLDTGRTCLVDIAYLHFCVFITTTFCFCFRQFLFLFCFLVLHHTFWFCFVAFGVLPFAHTHWMGGGLPSAMILTCILLPQCHLLTSKFYVIYHQHFFSWEKRKACSSPFLPNLERIPIPTCCATTYACAAFCHSLKYHPHLCLSWRKCLLCRGCSYGMACNLPAHFMWWWGDEIFSFPSCLPPMGAGTPQHAFCF